MLALVLALLAVCLLGFKLSCGPLQLPGLTSWLATAVSGQGISVQMQTAELDWAGYHEGGGVPFDLQLGGILVRNAEGVTLVSIPAARLDVLPAALFGAAAPILVSGTGAQFAGASVPVSLRAQIRLGPKFRLSDAKFQVSLAAGTLGAGTRGVAVAGGGFALEITPRAVVLSDGTLNLARAGQSAPQIRFSGQAGLENQWQGRLAVSLDAVQAADLAAYWPATLLAHARRWVTQNITAGTARDAALTFGLQAPPDLADVQLTSLSGGFDAQDATVSWINGVTPMTALNGRMVFDDLDHATITASTGRVGGLALSDGTMQISGLNEPSQVGELGLRVTGTIPALLAVLAKPPLSLLGQAPPQLSQATGLVDGAVQARIPFVSGLSFEEVGLRVSAGLRDVALPSPVPGLGFSAGAARLEATSQGLEAKGRAQLAGEPVALEVTAPFQAAAGPLRLTLNSLVGPVLLHRMGLDVKTSFADPVRGLAPYSLQIEGKYAGTQSASLAVDLTPESLAVPVLGWKKPAGVPGRLAMSATLSNGNLTALNHLAVSAPALNIQAEGGGGRILVPVLQIGRTQAQGAITLPSRADAGWSASFAGPVLDVRTPTSSGANSPAAPPAGLPPSGPDWQVKLNFAQAYLADSPAPPLTALVFSGSGKGGTLLAGQGTAQGLTLGIVPAGPLRRELTLQAADGGFLLRALGGYAGLQDGALRLDAVYGGGAVNGTLSLNKFRLSQAPAFAKTLQALTIYGVPAASSGPGMFFRRAVVPFSLGGQTLALHGARAFSASLGFTATGSIGLGDDTADLDTTIVPAYALNTLPGRICWSGICSRPRPAAGCSPCAQKSPARWRTRKLK